MRNTSNYYIHNEIQTVQKKWEWYDSHTFIQKIFYALEPRNVFR